MSGLCASSLLCLRTVTCSRSGSYSHTRLPSATMVCLYGAVVSQRNWRGACKASVPVLVLPGSPLALLSVWLKRPVIECSPLAKASRRSRAGPAAKVGRLRRDSVAASSRRFMAWIP